MAAFDTDRLSAYRPLIVLVRWATILVGIVVTFSQHAHMAEIVAGGALAVHALLRSIVPVRYSSPVSGIPGIIAELAPPLLAVTLTGLWGSPYVFTLATPVVAAGFAEGFTLAIPLAAIVVTGITLLHIPRHSSEVSLATEGTAEMVMVALVAGWSHRIFGMAEQRTFTALSRLTQLSQANDLLQKLNLVAQTLPASLDLGETIGSIMTQVRGLFQPDVSAIFLWDAVIGTWTPAGVEGARLPQVLDEAALPLPVRAAGQSALSSAGAFAVDLSVDGPGLTPAGRAGIYAPLVARQTLVGVLAIESRDPDAFATDHVDLVTGLSEQAALAIDNALWFSRLRTVGAEEERNRIARDLHDSVAQALAYLAFELERLVELSRYPTPITPELENLRQDVRKVVTEVRDTLYDLRTDVSDSQDLIETVREFLERVGQRSDLDVQLETNGERRLALRLEREIWRIAQEAVVNVERHARARCLKVTWSVDDRAAEMVITDDGIGFPLGTAGRMDSYGLLGMRERADAIGATLVIDSSPGRGTSIRCRVEAT